LVVTPVFYYVMARLLGLDKPRHSEGARPATPITESDRQVDAEPDGQPHGVIHVNV
jgi:hypothetical protein